MHFSVLILPIVLLFFVPCMAMDFIPPDPSERLQAIGPTDELPEILGRALHPGKDFKPIPVPERGDWLAQHSEPGQTFADFVRSNPNKPDRIQNKIYVQPLCVFEEARSPSLVQLKDFAGAYFTLEVEVPFPLNIEGARFTTRINPYSQNRQVLTTDVLGFFRSRLPTDAFCLLAVTMEDLYPHQSWNYVFGQASLHDRVGVFSFARYDPVFYGEKRSSEFRHILLRRSLKVLTHETGHMFGLNHCIFFNCVMNGSNHLKEIDSRPIHLCPVCLRKLQFSVGFDVVERYEKLIHLYREAGLHNEASWVSERLRRILGANKGR